MTAFLVPALDNAFEAFIPSDISYTLQAFKPLEYSDSRIANIPVLTTTVGDISTIPRGPRCVLFDGQDDGLNIVIPNPMSVGMWIKHSSPLKNFSRAFALFNTYSLFFDSSGNIYLYHNNALIGTFSGFTPDTVTHVFCTFDGTNAKLYVNGIQRVSGPSTALTGSGTFVLGAYDTGGTQTWNGKLWDVRIYSVPKSAVEIEAIYNQHLTPTTIDRTGLIAGWWLQDEGGTTLRDWSGNGRHLTAVNISTNTFHATDSGVRYNAANELGYNSYANLIENNIPAITIPLDTIRSNVTVQFEYIRPAGKSNFVLLSSLQGDIGIGQPASTSSMFNGATATIRINGVVIADQRQALSNAIPADTPVTVRIENANLTGWTSAYIGYQQNTAFDISGLVRNLKVDTNSNGTWDFESELGNTNGFTWGAEVSQVIVPRNEADITKDVLGNTLQYSGMTKLPSTVEVPCITFAAANSEYAEVTNTSRLTGEVTVACWYRHGGSAVHSSLVSLAANGSNIDFLLEVNRVPDRLSGLRNGGFVGVSSPQVLVLNRWYHVALVISGSSGNWTLRIYIDGVLSATGTDSGGASGNSDCRLRLAALVPGQFHLNGALSDVRIYSTSKSASQIQAIMNGEDDTVGVVASYPIQDGPGSSNTNRTIRDISGNGRHLTVVNGTVTNQWVNRTNLVEDWCLKYGGNISAGVFIPGNISGNNDVLGNPKQVLPGTLGPYSRMNFNNWSAPSLANINVPTSYREVPCFTALGGNTNFIDTGTQLIPLSGNWELEVWIFQPVSNTAYDCALAQSDAGGAWQSSFQFYNHNGVTTYRATYGAWNTHFVQFTLNPNAWNKVKLRKVGTTLFASVNDGVETSGTVLASITGNQNFTVAGSLGHPTVRYTFTNGRFSSVKVTTPTSVSEVPLSDGTGTEIARYTDGVRTLVSNAVQGLSPQNVWSNRTNGLFDPSPYALETIIPRDTKIGRNGRQFVTGRQPFTTDEKADILEWMES